MKRKLSTIMFASLLALASSTLAGCGNGGEDSSSSEPPATTTPVEHVHTFSDAWSSNGEQHWHSATCGHDVVSDLANHTPDAHGYCTVCKRYLGSELSPIDAFSVVDFKVGDNFFYFTATVGERYKPVVAGSGYTINVYSENAGVWSKYNLDAKGSFYASETKIYLSVNAPSAIEDINFGVFHISDDYGIRDGVYIGLKAEVEVPVFLNVAPNMDYFYYVEARAFHSYRFVLEDNTGTTLSPDVVFYTLSAQMEATELDNTYLDDDANLYVRFSIDGSQVVQNAKFVVAVDQCEDYDANGFCNIYPNHYVGMLASKTSENEIGVMGDYEDAYYYVPYLDGHIYYFESDQLSPSEFYEFHVLKSGVATLVNPNSPMEASDDNILYIHIKSTVEHDEPVSFTIDEVHPYDSHGRCVGCNAHIGKTLTVGTPLESFSVTSGQTIYCRFATSELVHNSGYIAFSINFDGFDPNTEAYEVGYYSSADSSWIDASEYGGGGSARNYEDVDETDDGYIYFKITANADHSNITGFYVFDDNL